MAGFFAYSTLIILIAAIAIGFYQRHKSENLTKSVAEWGKQHELKLENIKKEEFKVDYNEVEWNALVKKLEETRYFNRLKDVPDFSYGFNPEYAKELAEYWRTKFDWRKQVDKLNKYTQYRVTINNTVIHYIYHETNPELRDSKAPQPAINLMLVDGWPGCSFSFHKMIENIETEFKDVSFRIFVPSIPGYGYSSPLRRVVDSVDTSLLFDALMRYEKADSYYVHGEDWGSLVATHLANLFPNRVGGIQLTLPIAFGAEFGSIFDLFTFLIGQIMPNTFFTEDEIAMNFSQRYSISNRLWTMWFSFGYMHLQATFPDTLAHGLTDSPVGLLAYVLEKYSSWTFDYNREIVGKRDGGLERLNKDDLLSIVTIYWMTNSIASSVRYYKANLDLNREKIGIRKEIERAKVPARVRVAIQNMDNEVIPVPSRVIQMRYPNLTQYIVIKDAGHFAAFERPVETAKNFVKFILNSS